MSSVPDPHTFYAEQIPAQFNRALDEQAAKGEEGQRVYGGMCAVNASIRIEVEGEGGGTFFLNIAAGRMSHGAEPDRPPFLTLFQDRRAFDVSGRGRVWRDVAELDVTGQRAKQ